MNHIFINKDSIENFEPDYYWLYPILFTSIIMVIMSKYNTTRILF